jgi:hypothetical protein
MIHVVDGYWKRTLIAATAPLGMMMLLGSVISSLTERRSRQHL